jgi:hypothetical protein
MQLSLSRLLLLNLFTKLLIKRHIIKLSVMDVLFVMLNDGKKDSDRYKDR